MNTDEKNKKVLSCLRRSSTERTIPQFAELTIEDDEKDEVEEDISEDNEQGIANEFSWVFEGDEDSDSQIERDDEGFPIPHEDFPFLHPLTNPFVISKLERDKHLKSKKDILNSLADQPQTTTDTDGLSLKQLKENNAECSYTGCWEVKSLSRCEVMRRIEKVYGNFRKQGGRCYILQPKPVEHIYVKELECVMMNGIRKSKCYEHRGDKPNIRFKRFDTILNLIYNLHKKKMHVNKRWLQYAYTNLFKTDAVVDEILDSACVLIGCTRSNLGILSSDKGKVIGNVSFRYPDEGIICAKQRAQHILCEDVEYVEFVLRDVKKPRFILVVEKDTVFQRLAESKFQDHFQCIIMTGCGQPSIAARIFLKKMVKALDILVLVLTDSNPHGLEIFFTYLYGSISMAYNSRHLRTRGIKWLGVSPQDLIDFKSDEIQLYGENVGIRLERLGREDLKKKEELLERDFVKENLVWRKVLEQMTFRAEIEILSWYEFDYLSKIYLPKKLQDRDWIG